MSEAEICSLADRTCAPCRGGVPPLTPEEVAPLLEELGGGWTAVDDHHLTKDFGFPDFVSGTAFVNAATEVAESQGHHPDLHLTWGRVTVTVWTHKIDGLAEADFVLAAKLDRVYGG